MWKCLNEFALKEVLHVKFVRKLEFDDLYWNLLLAITRTCFKSYECLVSPSLKSVDDK